MDKSWNLPTFYDRMRLGLLDYKQPGYPACIIYHLSGCELCCHLSKNQWYPIKIWLRDESLPLARVECQNAIPKSSAAINQNGFSEITSPQWSPDGEKEWFRYHLVMTNIAMENPNHKWRFERENHLFLWAIYTMAMLNNKRVPTKKNISLCWNIGLFFVQHQWSYLGWSWYRSSHLISPATIK